MKINKTKLFGIGLFILMFVGYVIAEEVLTRTNPNDFIEIEITNGDGEIGIYTFPGLEIYCRGYFKGEGECTERDWEDYLVIERTKIENKVTPPSFESRLLEMEKDITDLKANLTDIKERLPK